MLVVGDISLQYYSVRLYITDNENEKSNGLMNNILLITVHLMMLNDVAVTSW